MFYVIDVEDVVGIPPSTFGADLNVVLKGLLNEEKIGKVDKDIGVVLGVVKVNKTGHAKVIPGDSNAYVDVEYSLLSFKPDLQNVYEGQIKEVAEFGAFMGLGPFDALIHVSQLMNDFVSFDDKNKHFIGKESNNILAKGDNVFARVVSVSYKANAVQSKIGLTMRQSGLGKSDWIEKQQSNSSLEKKKQEKKDKDDDVPSELKGKGKKAK
jgi:DNA-directed RNA polymerase subunit E'